jgi:hypothetical protein
MQFVEADAFPLMVPSTITFGAAEDLRCDPRTTTWREGQHAGRTAFAGSRRQSRVIPSGS